MDKPTLMMSSGQIGELILQLVFLPDIV